MKTLLALAVVLVALPCSAETAAKAPMRDAVSAEELAARARAAQSSDPTKNLPRAEIKGDTSVVSRPGDLMSRMTMLCSGAGVAMVPKQAILHVPKNYESRLQYTPGAKLQSWPEFYQENRGWIVTQEVSRAQAEGREPLSDDVKKALSKSPYVVVATYFSGPISVLSPKVPEDASKVATPGVPAKP